MLPQLSTLINNSNSSSNYIYKHVYLYYIHTHIYIYIISNHNKTALESSKIKEKQGKTCNCRDKKYCPLKGQCLQKVTVEQKP